MAETAETVLINSAILVTSGYLFIIRGRSRNFRRVDYMALSQLIADLVMLQLDVDRMSGMSREQLTF